MEMGPGPTARALRLTPDQAAALSSTASVDPKELAQRVTQFIIPDPSKAAPLSPQARLEYDVEEARRKGLDKAFLDQQTRIATAGEQAEALRPNLLALREQAAQAPGGLSGRIVGWLNSQGITVNTEAEAYSALVARVAPMLRQRGSGDMNQTEIENFLKSVSTLANSREGRRRIIETLFRINQNDIDEGAIAGDYIAGRASRQITDRRRRIGRMSREDLEKLPDDVLRIPEIRAAVRRRLSVIGAQ
jgi:hypothetical protein